MTGVFGSRAWAHEAVPTLRVAVAVAVAVEVEVEVEVDVDVDVDVEVEVDVDLFRIEAAAKSRSQAGDQKAALFERSEFAAFPLTGSGFWEPAGQPLRGRLFLGAFFLAKQKEDTGCRAAPGLVMTECIQN
ncbi:MAG: hypothetical protein ACI802_002058 [Candidatus Paceibacteria bacterium]